MCKNCVLTLPIAAMIAGILTMVAGNRSLASSEPTAAAAVCIDEGADGNLDEFAKCWVVNMMSDDQRRVAHCIAVNKGLGGAAFCMSGMQLSPFGLQVAKCAQRHSGDARAIAGCVGLPVLPPEGQRLAACVAVNPQNFWGAALCAGGHELTPEQEVFANCAVATGLQTRGMVVCIGGQVTMDELQKCLNVTVVRDRCFGDADDVTQLACEAWRGMGAEIRPEPAAADLWQSKVGLPQSRPPGGRSEFGCRQPRSACRRRQCGRPKPRSGSGQQAVAVSQDPGGALLD